MEKKSGKRIACFVICIALLCSLMLTAGCKNRETPDLAEYSVYYVNYDYTGVIAQPYQTESEEAEKLLEELLAELSKEPEKLQYHAPLSSGFTLLEHTLQAGQLTLNFEESYHNQELLNEILNRAAIVRTLSQIREVQYVSFLVDGKPLQDASGNVVGVMSAENFIDNAGKEINTYEKARLQLYFANETGNKLIPVTRTTIYNSNISLERLVVDEIIAGPKDSDSLPVKSRSVCPVINPETKVVSVNIRDGICYVNLDAGFVNQTYSVLPEVTLYAITNSLVELSGVNKVQFMVDGENNINYREYSSLSAIFERNLDLIEQ